MSKKRYRSQDESVLFSASSEFGSAAIGLELSVCMTFFRFGVAGLTDFLISSLWIIPAITDNWWTKPKLEEWILTSVFGEAIL